MSSVASERQDGHLHPARLRRLSSSLGRDFRYPLEAEARKLLEEGGKRELRGFKAPEVRVSPDALVLVIDFELRVK